MPTLKVRQSCAGRPCVLYCLYPTSENSCVIPSFPTQDNDFTSRGEKLYLGSDRERVLEMVQRDAKLLQSCRLMDYSLLVAVHSYDGVRVLPRRTLRQAVQAPAPSTSFSLTLRPHVTLPHVTACADH